MKIPLVLLLMLSGCAGPPSQGEDGPSQTSSSTGLPDPGTLAYQITTDEVLEGFGVQAVFDVLEPGNFSIMLRGGPPENRPDVARGCGSALLHHISSTGVGKDGITWSVARGQAFTAQTPLGPVDHDDPAATGSLLLDVRDSHNITLAAARGDRLVITVAAQGDVPGMGSAALKAIDGQARLNRTNDIPFSCEPDLQGFAGTHATSGYSPVVTVANQASRIYRADLPGFGFFILGSPSQFPNSCSLSIQESGQTISEMSGTSICVAQSSFEAGEITYTIDARATSAIIGHYFWQWPASAIDLGRL